MTDYPPNNAGELAARSLAKGDPTGWFETLYAHADATGRGVPWASMAPDPALVRWLTDQAGPAANQRALVVGCGLGDDAEAVARRGFDVIAFDVAESAIELCRRRFPDSPVTYLTANLLDPPAQWHHAFDLVVENTTVQSLPPGWQREAIQRIAGFAAPGGRVFVLTTVCDPQLQPSGPPWPVAAPMLTAFEQAGLVQERLIEQRLGAWDSVWHVESVYRRPA